METRCKHIPRTNLFRAILPMAVLILLSGAAFAEDAGRISVTTQMPLVERDQGLSGAISNDEFAPLLMTGARDKGTSPRTQSKTGLTAEQSPNIDFWFYSADVVLFNDHDDDGYFHGVDLLFDADTYFVSAEVYAVVYLSYEGGPWNEYAVTDDFTLFGASAEDEYVIVTELVAGYPSGNYDLLIELFDAWDDSFLAYYGPDDTPELAFLPLEDADRDAPVEVIPEVIVVHEHGGGAAGWLLLTMLGAAAVASRRQ